MIKSIVLALLLLQSNNAYGYLQFQGLWGEFYRNFGDTAPFGYYACGAMIQNQPDQGVGDDTAMNGLEMRFCNISDWDDQITLASFGMVGEWQYSEYKVCPKGQFIIGARVLRQQNQYGGDDTAVNGIQFACCEYPRNRGESQFTFLTFNGNNKGTWTQYQYNPFYKNKDKPYVKFFLGIVGEYELIFYFKTQYQWYSGAKDNSGINGFVFISRCAYQRNFCDFA